ncbi:MAG: hypothetical protein U0269_26895 [Polyangiales bacterium]
MKPWKWSGFQVDASSVIDWLFVHSRPQCSVLLCVDDLRERAGITLDPDDGWHEDLRSRRFWDSLSTTTNPPRMHCAHCQKWLGTLVDDHQARRLEGVREPIVIGTFLWLCDERCLEAFAAQPGRVFRPTPKRSPDEILRVSCPHCDKGIEANRVSPLVLADWFTEHIAAECSLEVTRGR